MGSGYMTDEELELCQTIDQPSADISNTAAAANDSSDITHVHNRATNNATPQTTASMDTAIPYNATAAADSLEATAAADASCKSCRVQHNSISVRLKTPRTLLRVLVLVSI